MANDYDDEYSDSDDNTGLLVVGGLAAAGIGAWLLLKPKAAPSPSPPPPPPPPPAPIPCNYVAVPPGYGTAPGWPAGNVAPGVIQHVSQWYNWSDLRPLPLNPNDIPGPTTGGTTAQTGTPTGAQVIWNEAKVGPDGAWYCRIGSTAPGAWALRATDINANPAQFCH